MVMKMTLWQQMDQQHLSRYRLAECIGVPIDEISDLCSGKRPLTECSEETLAKLAETLKIPQKDLLEMKTGTLPYLRVYGEALDTLYHEADQGRPPEEILTKGHLAELFLSAADQFGRKAEKRAHYEARHREEGGGDPLDEFICGRVFNIRKNQDPLLEYQALERQVEECLQFLEKKLKEYSIAGNEKGKLKYLYDAASERRSDLKKRAKPRALVEQALRNVTLEHLNWWWPRDFRMEIPQFLELEQDHRTAIFFGDLPFQKYRELIKLSRSDHEAYLDVFKQIILTNDIPKQLRQRTEENIYLHDRTAIMQTAVNLFEEENYQPFVYLLVPQIEGLLRIYQDILARDAGKGEGKELRGIKSVTDKIDKLEFFLEYSYFTFDFCDELRNPIAHGYVLDAGRERAYEVLMDAWWLVDQIDAPDCGYRRWMKLVRDCAVKTDAQVVGYLLDAFSGIEKDKNMALLRRHLGHGFEKELAWYSLTEDAERLDSLLRSQGLYNAIWGGSPIRYTEKLMEPDGKMVPVRELERDTEKHRMLAELLHQYGAAPEDWYTRYMQHCEERRHKFDDILAKLAAEND